MAEALEQPAAQPVAEQPVPQVAVGVAPAVAERPAEPRPAPPREPLTMKSLLEAGVHFGHQTRRWNPRMKKHIFTQRNGIHIVDLQQTLGMINDSYKAMTQLVAGGGKVLFVGTKRQAQEVVQSEADRCGMWYVNQRWLGGTLTNFQTIRSRINYMLELQQKRDQGYFRVLPKKEAVKLRDKLNRLEKYFLGMRDMTQLPAALFVIDIGKENICIAEAQRMGVEIFAIVDTDCDPTKVTHVIPGNDDAVRSIRLITGRMATAALEGLAQREAMMQAEQEELALAQSVRDELEEEEFGISDREEAALNERVGSSNEGGLGVDDAQYLEHLAGAAPVSVAVTSDISAPVVETAAPAPAIAEPQAPETPAPAAPSPAPSTENEPVAEIPVETVPTKEAEDPSSESN